MYIWIPRQTLLDDCIAFSYENFETKILAYLYGKYSHIICAGGVSIRLTEQESDRLTYAVYKGDGNPDTIIFNRYTLIV